MSHSEKDPNSDNNQDLSSIGSMSSTNSSESSLISANYAKNLLFHDKPPRVLTINIYILILMLIVFFIVSIYNLIIFLVKYGQISGRQLAFYNVSSRNAQMRASTLDLKIMNAIVQNMSLYD